MKRYKVAYIDPPWAYSDKQGNRPGHYRRMSLREIRWMPVADSMAPDSVILLWTTAPMMRAAMACMDAWGFEFKTVCFCWVKTKADGQPAVGMGHYARSNAEFVLLGVRGKGVPVVSHSVNSVILEPRREHSRKPDCVRDRIVQLFGDVPRIELFARGTVPEGWDSWGDQATNSIGGLT